MAYLDHIRALNQWQPDRFLPLLVDAQRLGWIRHDFAALLSAFPDCFLIDEREVTLHSQLSDVTSSTEAVAGVLQQLVAGGLPHGISLLDNLIKECHEEATMPEDLARQAVAVAQIRYCCEVANGVRDDTLFCYDLKLSPEFVPLCNDDEVAGFELMPIEEVAEIVCESEAFKPNCNLVVIDFLQRHGFIEPVWRF